MTRLTNQQNNVPCSHVCSSREGREQQQLSEIACSARGVRVMCYGRGSRIRRLHAPSEIHGPPFLYDT